MKQHEITEVILAIEEKFAAGVITEEEFRLQMDEVQKQMDMLPPPQPLEPITFEDEPVPTPASSPNLLGHASPSSQSPSNPFVPMKPPLKEEQSWNLRDSSDMSWSSPDASSSSNPRLPASRAPSQGPSRGPDGFVPTRPGSASGASSDSFPGLPAHAASTVSEEKQQQFMTLYTKATQQVAEHPEKALRYMEEARLLAPSLVNDVFRQWMKYAKFMIRQRREPSSAPVRRQPPQNQPPRTSPPQTSPPQTPPPRTEKAETKKSSETTNPGFEVPKSLAASVQENQKNDPASILLEAVEDLLAEEDFNGAIVLLEHLINQFPEIEKVKSLYQMCRLKIEDDYKVKYEEPASLFPSLTCSSDELLEMKNKLDHRVGFLVSQIDGNTSILQLIMISGLDDFEVFRFLDEIENLGVLSLEKR